ncbi:MAG: amino acid permease, partial [Pseudomonadota bacterium]
MQNQTTLKRSLSLPLVVLYGLGTTIGAGIYALLGEVARNAGMQSPWAFLIASLIASFTALSFAEMVSRFPRSAGEALYVRKGLGLSQLATLVGLLVVLAGCVSSATLINGFIGYLAEFVVMPPDLVILLLGLSLGLLAAWGIAESVLLAAVFTLLEIGGLLLVIWSAREGFGEIPAQLPHLMPGWDPAAWYGIFGASLLAFYAFLGFEDMVNVAEEVKNVRRVLPLGIILTLLITALLYVFLSLSAVLTVPPHELGSSQAPLSLVYERNTGRSSTAISSIALFAIINGALIQLIMASRVLYGLANQASLPAALAYVHPRTRTPLLATALVTALIIPLALWFPLAKLAESTSIITLIIFTLVNLALWRLKGQAPAPAGVWSVPRWIPTCGFFSSLGLLLFGLWHLLGSA